LTSALDGGERSASRPGLFIRRERAPGTIGLEGGYMYINIYTYMLIIAPPAKLVIQIINVSPVKKNFMLQSTVVSTVLKYRVS